MMGQAGKGMELAVQSRRRPVGKLRPAELRIGAIDVGSNSIHMVVAQADGDGGLSVLWRAKEMVGLGRLSFPSRWLSQEAMDRATVTLRRFLEEAQRRQCEQVLAVATSAVREAENGGAFIQRVRQELGLHVRVVSAQEEARLIYLGVRHAVSLAGGPHLLLDIGGGSVEFIVASSEKPLLLASRKLGAARMTARFIRSDPVEARELRALLAHYSEELDPLIEEIRRYRPVRMLGSSGTLENIAAMCEAERAEEGRAIITRPALERLVDELTESRSADRAAMRGLDEKRKDQIVAGALLAREVMRRLDARQIEIVHAALREGIVIDHLARHWPEIQVRREVPDPRRRAIIDLGRRCHWQRDHSEQVARLCMLLFEQLRGLHGLGRSQRELIEYGALLHDIGALIGRARHHKHSMYLILNGELAPFSREEVAIIANVARYHRKAPPRNRHEEFARLSAKGRYTVQVGAALLRIADGLDRTSSAVVEDLRCRVGRRRVDITLLARGDTELEVWSARARSKLFTEVFHRTVSFRVKPARGAR